MHLRFHRLRFDFVARESLHFPAYKSSNIFRGAFGMLFRQFACVPECAEPARCPLAGRCLYEQIFAPIARDTSPSGFHDLPRPLVFRAAHLDGLTVPPGARFHIGVNSFSADPMVAASLARSFEQLARTGIGPRRGRAQLLAAQTLHLDGTPQSRLFEAPARPAEAFPPPLVLPLSPISAGTARPAPLALRVHFLTPTELKHEGRVLASPLAPVLLARAIDRITSLIRLYAFPAAPVSGAEIRRSRDLIVEAADQVSLRQVNLTKIEAARTSARTGRVHPLDGFVGFADYEGPADVVALLTPWLRAAAFTGVGRQTVWGKGEIRIESQFGTAS